MMRIFYLIILFYIGNSNFYAQKMDSLKVKTVSFYKAYVDLNFDKLIDIYHPNYTLVDTRNIIKKTLNDFFNGPQIEYRFDNETPYFNYSKITIIDKNEYCVINFKYKYNLFFKRKLTDEQVELNKKSYKNHSNQNFLKYNKNTNSYLIEKYEKWIAVLGKETNFEWRFIELNTMYQLPNELISKDILDKLNF
jgi:hypothetical protein